MSFIASALDRVPPKTLADQTRTALSIAMDNKPSFVATASGPASGPSSRAPEHRDDANAPTTVSVVDDDDDPSARALRPDDVFFPPASSYDEQGDFHREELAAFIGTITTGHSADATLLTPLQAFLLMRMYRQAAVLTTSGVKHTKHGQVAELVAAVCSATLPVLVGLQTQFNQHDSATPYWLLNLATMGLSLTSTVAVAIERTKGMKEKGVLERMAGADQLLELKRFVAGTPPYSSDYRKSFELLSVRLADIQYKGTSDVYSATARSPPQSPQDAQSPPRATSTTKTLSPIKPIARDGLDFDRRLGENGLIGYPTSPDIPGTPEDTGTDDTIFDVESVEAGPEP